MSESRGKEWPNRHKHQCPFKFKTTLDFFQGQHHVNPSKQHLILLVELTIWRELQIKHMVTLLYQQKEIVLHVVICRHLTNIDIIVFQIVANITCQLHQRKNTIIAVDTYHQCRK